MAIYYTTLKKIRANNPCAEGWSKLLEHLGKTKADDEPLSLKTILDSNGIKDAAWAAARAAAWDTAWDAAWDAARDAASSAARDAAWDAAWAEQTELFIEMFCQE